MEKIKFEIWTDRRERYLVTEEDNIIRTDIDHSPSGKWKAVGVVEVLPFGRLGDMQSLESVAETNMRFKNGKGRFMLVDFDHGSQRIWGNRVVAIDRAQDQEFYERQKKYNERWA